MTATISDSLRQAGRKIASTEEHGLAAALNAALDSILPEFYVGPGVVVDADGARSGDFPSLVATEPPDTDGAVRADAVAVAAYVCKNLDASSLADGYKQIAAVRRLRKTPSAVDSQTTNTLGLIVAAQTDLSLDEVAKEMRDLNHGVEDHWRPDMAAIFAQGVVSYGMSFFDEPAVGAYLQPKAGTRLAPPINVHLIVSETETDALNKLCGLLSGHLAFFAPSVPRPDMRSVLDGAPQNAAIAWTYQYDVAGKLADARLVESDAPAYLIEDRKGTLLCRLRFQRWQDGGIIVADGGLPLSGLLALTGKGFPTTTFPRAGGRQLSCVLPIVERDFVELMGTISKRSTGMVVRAEPPQFAIVKLLDEGTSTPFVARLYMTPLTIRDAAFTSKDEIAEYDRLFQFMLNHLVDVRKTAQAIVGLWETYAARVASGEVARYDNALHIDEPIDQPLNAHVKSFVLDAARAAKKMQHLIALFGIELGFLFQKDKQYNKGLSVLRGTDPILADYLRESRKWLQPLRLFRDELEHGTVIPNTIRHERAGDGTISAKEPIILGMALTEFVRYIENRLDRFVEEILIWGFQRTLPAPMTITEIPLAARDPDKVERFKMTLVGSPEPPWRLTYSVAAFEDA